VEGSPSPPTAQGRVATVLAQVCFHRRNDGTAAWSRPYRLTARAQGLRTDPALPTGTAALAALCPVPWQLCSGTRRSAEPPPATPVLSAVARCSAGHFPAALQPRCPALRFSACCSPDHLKASVQTAGSPSHGSVGWGLLVPCPAQQLGEETAPLAVRVLEPGMGGGTKSL